jgi:hypothetical protein
VTSIGTAAPVRLHVDNSEPSPQITALHWRLPGGAPQTLQLNCPTINRNQQAIEIVLDVQVMAAHLRSVQLYGHGCGSGNPDLKSGFEAMEGLAPPATASDYWHKSPGDNAITRQVVWSVPATLPPGAYSFGLIATSRAFDPGDGHVYAPANSDVGYDPWPHWAEAQTTIAIVD